jgi:predicted transcriptional regulator
VLTGFHSTIGSNIAQPDVSIAVDDINAWFALRIKKTRRKRGGGLAHKNYTYYLNTD